MTDDTVYTINPPADYLEVMWRITVTKPTPEYIDWITDELKPETEQVVEIFDCTKNNQGLSDGTRG